MVVLVVLRFVVVELSYPIVSSYKMNKIFKPIRGTGERMRK